jgi:enoyl-CoA hydratase
MTTAERKTLDVSGTPTITVERAGHVLLIGLNRVEKRNALDPAMSAGLVRAYTLLDEDDELRAGILYGHGDHFTSGIDLPAMAASMARERPAAPAEGVSPLGLGGRPCRKPVVVAVQGRCYTVGIEYILASEIAVAAENTIFAQLEVARGIFPLAGANWRMPERVGWGNAMRYVLTADEFDAAEALRIGLVQEVVPVGQQVERALAIAERIASRAPLGVQAALLNARKGLREGEAAAYADVAPTRVRLMATEDAKEGVQAMVERREPRFQGR